MNLLPDYKTIVDLIKKGATLEAQEMIIKLREIAVDLEEENLSLKKRIKELEAALTTAGELEWDGRVYWRRGVQGAPKEGPYCQPCYDQNQKLIRLQLSYIPRRGQDSVKAWSCLICEKKIPQAGQG